MAEKTTGEHSGITISSEAGYGEKVAKAVPIAGGLVKGVGSTRNALSDGQVTAGEVVGLATEATSFIQSCTDAAAGIASDPIGWLVGQGLNFLIVLVQPLQDLIHWVSGDGPALSNAAGNFNSVATGLAKFAQTYHQDAAKALEDWSGDAKDAAQLKIDSFRDGVQGTAGEAGNIAQLLQISSMIMTVIEEFIKALLTELITWLVMIWIPALASAVVTAGASTAAATAASSAKGVQTAGTATRKVSLLQRLLDKIRKLITMLKTFFQKLGPEIKNAFTSQKLASAIQTGVKEAGGKSATTKLYAEGGAIGKRVLGGYTEGGGGGLGRSFAESMGNAAEGSIKGQVGLTNDGKFKPTKPIGHLGNVKKAGDYGSTGTEQDHEETSDDLNF